MPDLAFESFQNAIADNNAGELKRLLDAGYDPNARFEENGLTPLHLTAWYNRPHLIELLIDHEAKVNQTEEQTEKTPLHIAAPLKLFNQRFPTCPFGIFLEKSIGSAVGGQ